MKRSLCRALVMSALLLAAMSLAGCSMTPASILVEFTPSTVTLLPQRTFDVNITLIANGIGFFKLDAVKLTLKDALGNLIVFTPPAEVANPYVVVMKQDIPVLGLAGTIVSSGLLSNYLDDDARTLPAEAWLMNPKPASLVIEFVDTAGKIRGGGALGLSW